MAQLNPGDWSITPDATDGPTLAEKLNRLVAATCSSFRGPSRPTHATSGMIWVQSGGANGDVVMLFDGTNDVPIIEVDPVTSSFNLLNTYTEGEVDAMITAVQNQINSIVTIPIGGIIMWSGSTSNIPANFRLCDGANGTPNLRDRFIVGAGNSYSVGQTGGAATVTLAVSQIPSHSHVVDPPNTRFWTNSPNASGSFGSVITEDNPFANGIFSRVIDKTDEGETSGSSYDRMTVTFNWTHNHYVDVNLGSFWSAANGSGGSHENRPPYYALAFIMRVS